MNIALAVPVDAKLEESMLDLGGHRVALMTNDCQSAFVDEVVRAYDRLAPEGRRPPSVALVSQDMTAGG